MYYINRRQRLKYLPSFLDFLNLSFQTIQTIQIVYYILYAEGHSDIKLI